MQFRDSCVVVGGSQKEGYLRIPYSTILDIFAIYGGSVCVVEMFVWIPYVFYYLDLFWDARRKQSLAVVLSSAAGEVFVGLVGSIP